MKLFKLFLSLTMTALLVSCSSPKTSTSASASATTQPSTVTITDHADREVEVPTNPKRVAVLGIYPLPSMLTVYLDSCDSIVAMEPGSMNAAKMVSYHSSIQTSQISQLISWMEMMSTLKVCLL